MHSDIYAETSKYSDENPIHTHRYKYENPIQNAQTYHFSGENPIKNAETHDIIPMMMKL